MVSAMKYRPVGYRHELTLAKERAINEHRSLIAVVEYQHDPNHPMSDNEMIDRHGLSHLKHIRFTTTNRGGHAASGQKIGGHAMFFVNHAKQNCSAILLKRISGISDEWGGALNLAVMYHELGHVDDFEKRINLVPGQPLDVVKAEVYAHNFALAKLSVPKIATLSLAFWFAAIEMSQAKCGVDNIEEVCELLMKKGSYQDLRKLVANIIPEFSEMLESPNAV